MCVHMCVRKGGKERERERRGEERREREGGREKEGERERERERQAAKFLLANLQGSVHPGGDSAHSFTI